MSEYKRNIDGLALGRGKRPKLDHSIVGIRMSAETKAALERIAASYDLMYGGKPQIGGLLERIASGKYIVVLAPPQKND